MNQNEFVLDTPIKCLAFSPNWYLSQICSYDASTGMFAFGCNSDVYILNYPLKKYSTIVVGKSMRDKITCVSFYSLPSSDLILFVGNSQGNIELYFFNKDKISFSLIDSQDLIQGEGVCGSNSILFVNFSQKDFQNIEIQISSQSGSKYVLLFNFIVLKFSKMNSYLKAPSNKLKLLSKQIGCTFQLYEEGIISIYDHQNYHVLIHYLDGKILAADALKNEQEDGSVNENKCPFIVLKKVKNQLFLVELEVDKKEIAEENISYCLREAFSIELSFVYENNKKNNIELIQSSFSLISLTNQLIVLSGKIGDMYLCHWSHFKNQNTQKSLVINPLSLQQPHQYFSLFPNSKHSSGIFSMVYEPKNQLLITLSVDRNINFFNFKDKPINFEEQQEGIEASSHLEFEWQVNCLGGKVNCLSASPIEKELLYLNCIDHSLRVWDSSKEHDQLYVKEYTKSLNQFNIKSLVLHPSQENLILLQLEDSPSYIVGYDLQKEKISFEFGGGKDTMGVKWIHKSLVEEVSSLCFSSPVDIQEVEKPHKNIKMPSDKFEQRDNSIKFDDNWCLLVVKKGGYLSIFDLVSKSFVLEEYQICESKVNINHIELFQIYDQLLFILSQSEGISFYFNYSYHQLQNIHKNVVKSIALKQNGTNTILCCGSYDRRISVFSCEQDNLPNFNFIIYLKHELPIEKIRFCQEDQYYFLLAVCQNNNSIQVYNLQNINLPPSDQPEGENLARRFEYKNIRGHRGYINDAIFSPLNSFVIISCSDDQTVKFWDIEKIQNKSYVKRKKNKKGQIKPHFQPKTN